MVLMDSQERERLRTALQAVGVERAFVASVSNETEVVLIVSNADYRRVGADVLHQAVASPVRKVAVIPDSPDWRGEAL